MANGVRVIDEVIEVYAPYLFENELEKKGNNLGGYNLDFRLGSLNANSVSFYSSYIMEGIPMSSITGGLAKSYDNFVLANKIPTDVNDRRGSLKDHPNLYQAIYGNILLENKAILRSKHEDVSEREKMEAKIRGLSIKSSPHEKNQSMLVWVIVLSSLYVEVSGNNIIGLSPLLEHMKRSWKIQNGNREPSQRDWFGCDNIAGLSYSGSLSNYFYSQVDVDLDSMTVSSNPYDSVKMPIWGNHPRLERYQIKSGNDPSEQDWYKIYVEGGSYSESNSSSQTSPVENNFVVNPKTTEGPLTGTGTPGWTIKATFPRHNYKVAIVGTDGSWTIDYPSNANFSSEDVDNIKVTQSSLSVASSSNFSSSTYTPPTAVKNSGLVTLIRSVDSVPNKGISASNPVPHMISEENFPLRGSIPTPYSNFLVFTKDTRPFVNINFYVGRGVNSTWSSIETDIDKCFLAFPGSVVTQTGVDIFVYYDMKPTDETGGYSDRNPPTNVLEISQKVISIGVGPVDYNFNEDFLFTSWETERPYNTTDKIKFRYRVKYDPIVEKYGFKWNFNSELLDKTDRISLDWLIETVSQQDDEYYFKYKFDLPEVVGKNELYNFKWDYSGTALYQERIRFRYTSEMSKEIYDEYNFSWVQSLIDKALIKPYYLRKVDSKGNVIHSISYTVYVDLDYVNQFLVSNNFYLYFSNPTKYELIRFDYNQQPYEGIFLRNIDDPVLDNRENIPSRYTKLGNYTIDNIDINSSCSLDIFADNTQLNEYRSYWVPEDVDSYSSSFLELPDGTKVLDLKGKFKDDHHEDVVELDLIIINETECCFTKTTVGSKCSPY